jgi:hypothetical protein
MNERKAGLKAKLEAELAAAASEDDLTALRDRFSAEERALEHEVDHEIHTFSATIDVAYNVRASPPEPAPRALSHAPSVCVAVPLQVSRVAVLGT